MSETIFVNQPSGTYKAYETKGGWAIQFVDEKGNARPVDYGKIYKHRQNAYRRAKQLNEAKEPVTFEVIAWHVAIEDRSLDYGGRELEKKTFSSEEEMLQYVANSKNAIIDGEKCNRIDVKSSDKTKAKWEDETIKEARILVE